MERERIGTAKDSGGCSLQVLSFECERTENFLVKTNKSTAAISSSFFSVVLRFGSNARIDEGGPVLLVPFFRTLAEGPYITSPFSLQA